MLACWFYLSFDELDFRFKFLMFVFFQVEMERAEQQLIDAMTSPVVHAASQMGFETRVIRRVVRKYDFVVDFRRPSMRV